MSATTTMEHAAIGEGGPLRWLEARCHLTRFGSQLVAALVITWVPLVVFGVIHEAATGFRIPALHDPTVHVRLLVCIPVLLFLDRLFPSECRLVIDQLVLANHVTEPERDRYHRLVRRTVRLGDWWVPELIIAAFVLCVGVLSVQGKLPVRALSFSSQLTVVDWWYAMIALPLFEFLLLRSLWRWTIWVSFLFGLSRLDLDLESTHPDRHGGIAFIRIPSVTYCGLLLFAASSALSAEWLARFRVATFSGFLPLLVGLALFAMTIAFGPLVLFIPRVQRVRRAGLIHLGRLAAGNGRWFRKYWSGSGGGEILGGTDGEGLAALGVIYRDTVKAISLVPFTKRELLLIVAATLGPVVPLMLLQIPQSDWVAMLKLLKGFP